MSSQELEKVLLSLPMQDKIRLARRLTEETGSFRFKGLMRVAQKLRRGIRSHKLTPKQVDELVEKSRQAYHDRSRH